MNTRYVLTLCTALVIGGAFITVIGDRAMLSVAPNSTMDRVQVGHRCGPRAFEE